MAIGMQKQRNIQFALFERIGWDTERVKREGAIVFEREGMVMEFQVPIFGCNTHF